MSVPRSWLRGLCNANENCSKLSGFTARGGAIPGTLGTTAPMMIDGPLRPQDTAFVA